VTDPHATKGRTSLSFLRHPSRFPRHYANWVVFSATENCTKKRRLPRKPEIASLLNFLQRDSQTDRSSDLVAGHWGCRLLALACWLKLPGEQVGKTPQRSPHRNVAETVAGGSSGRSRHPKWACRAELAKRIILALFVRISRCFLDHYDASATGVAALILSMQPETAIKAVSLVMEGFSRSASALRVLESPSSAEPPSPRGKPIVWVPRGLKNPGKARFVPSFRWGLFRLMPRSVAEGLCQNSKLMAALAPATYTRLVEGRRFSRDCSKSLTTSLIGLACVLTRFSLYSPRIK
jgi:hypothetical protein